MNKNELLSWVLSCGEFIRQQLTSSASQVLSILQDNDFRQTVRLTAYAAAILIACSLVFFLLVVPLAHAKSVYCTNCSTNIVQALEKAQGASQLKELVSQVKEAVKQTETQMNMLQQEIQQYQNMVQNTVQLPKELINKVKGKLTEIAALTKQLKTQRGDLTALGQVFTQLYPDMTDLSEIDVDSPEAIEAASERYKEHLDKWSARVDEATQATFQLSGQQLDALQENSAEFDSYLDNLLSTPDGQMKAIMSGNQLAALQVQEARQLRELVGTSIQSDIASRMKKEKQEQLMEKRAKELREIDPEVSSKNARKLKY